MSKSYSRYLWVLPVLWMCVIFMFSNQPSEDSSQLSGEVTKIIESVAEYMRINTALFDLHLFIRKAAHFTEFAVLGLLLYIAIYPSSIAAAREDAAGKVITNNAAASKVITNKAAVRAGLLAQSAGMAYAVFDEIHQVFIPGRSGQVKDMLIDSSGVLLAVLLCLAFITIRNRIRFE